MMHLWRCPFCACATRGVARVNDKTTGILAEDIGKKPKDEAVSTPREGSKESAGHKPQIEEDEKPEDESASLDDAKAEVPKVSENDREQLEAFAKGEREKLERSYLLRRFWRTATGFWMSRGRDRLAWLLTASLLILILLNLAAQYGINRWNREIFDALEKHDGASVLFLAGVFFPLAIASVGFGVVNVWARMST